MHEDPHDEEWPHTDAVAVRSQQHRTDGNWAIGTANPDGWGNILEYLKLSSADFVVGQESKRATKADCELAESAGLDPVFSEKFLRFVIDEVIRHHENASNGD